MKIHDFRGDLTDILAKKQHWSAAAALPLCTNRSLYNGIHSLWLWFVVDGEGCELDIAIAKSSPSQRADKEQA